MSRTLGDISEKLMKTNYVGLTYPKIFSNKLARWLWKRYLCSKNCHLFDECMSDSYHYLSCDACELAVHISHIESLEKARRIATGLKQASADQFSNLPPDLE